MTDPKDIYDAALDACNHQDWGRALDLGLRLLRESPNHAGICYIVGMANLELRRLPQAVEYLGRATMLDPLRANFAVQYAKALWQAQLPALQAVDRATALFPDSLGLLIPLGMIYAQANAHERAATVFRRVVELAPRDAASRYALGMSLIFVGDIEAAERELDTCIALDATFWKAHLSRSQIRRQTEGSHHVEELEALLAQHDKPAADSVAKTCLHMALAKEYEDLARYPMAFNHMVRGKKAARSDRCYDSQQDEQLFSAIMEYRVTAAETSQGHPTAEPIFVLGMPRSGTTLVERIISNHSDVHSAGELRNFPLALKRMSGSSTPQLLDKDTLSRSQQLDWRLLGERYLSSTRPGTGQSPRFIDKLPHNFMYIGMIANALPNAKIICVRRNAMDTCLGNFRQLFDLASPFHDYSYDLLDIGRYYVLFDRLMRHWQQTLPGRVLEMKYETLVASQEAATRNLIDFCELSWNDACLHFESNKAAVATASAVQVRTGLTRDALDRWRNYQPQLEVLRELLVESKVMKDH